MSVLWSWGLAASGLVGIWLVGQRRPAGWAVLTVLQIFWIIYATVTQQWGFVVSSCIYGVMNGRNWYKWNRQKPTAKTEEREQYAVSQD